MALELKSKCERCERPLPQNSKEAFIRSYECTFCAHCAEKELRFVLNCKGELTRRPTRVATTTGL